MEDEPWGDGKHQLTRAYMLFLARGARKLSWKETSEAFHTCWDQVCDSAGYVGRLGTCSVARWSRSEPFVWIHPVRQGPQIPLVDLVGQQVILEHALSYRLGLMLFMAASDFSATFFGNGTKSKPGAYFCPPSRHQRNRSRTAAAVCGLE